MRILFLISAIMIATSALAKVDKTTAKSTDKKYQGPVESPPGGGRADHFLVQQWENMIEPQKFPQLLTSKELGKLEKSLPEKQTERQRYIFQIDTAHVDLKNEIWDDDDGYYRFAYSTKEQGDFLIVVHPKYRKCFDDLKKKFDYMQAEVYQLGELVGRQQVVLEYPRQCLGQLKRTGSKLPSAKGLME